MASSLLAMSAAQHVLNQAWLLCKHLRTPGMGTCLLVHLTRAFVINVLHERHATLCGYPAGGDVCAQRAQRVARFHREALHVVHGLQQGVCSHLEGLWTDFDHAMQVGERCLV